MKRTKNGHKVSEVYLERIAAWVRALRKNKLKCEDKMRDDKGGRCCLAVAEDVYLENVKPDKHRKMVGFPSKKVARYFGWSDNDPVILNSRAGRYNDGDYGFGYKSFTEMKTHKQIATIVEKEYGLGKGKGANNIVAK